VGQCLAKVKYFNNTQTCRAKWAISQDKTLSAKTLNYETLTTFSIRVLFGSFLRPEGGTVL
jgi:hypothetical protein